MLWASNSLVSYSDVIACCCTYQTPATFMLRCLSLPYSNPWQLLQKKQKFHESSFFVVVSQPGEEFAKLHRISCLIFANQETFTSNSCLGFPATSCARGRYMPCSKTAQQIADRQWGVLFYFLIFFLQSRDYGKNICVLTLHNSYCSNFIFCVVTVTFLWGQVSFRNKHHLVRVRKRLSFVYVFF